MAFCLLAPAFGQSAEPSVTISPAVPRPGELVLLSISVPRVAASELEALEPELEGPLRYIGSYLRPLGIAGDGTAPAEGSVIELRLLALAPGRAEIRNLGYKAQGRPVYLGGYAVDIAPAPGSAAVSRPGSWLAPESAYPYAPFMVRAVGPEGEALAIATPSVRGAVFYPVGALPAAAFLVSISGEGSVTLPALELIVGSKPVRVEARTVARRSLPAAVEETRAVGAWSVTLRAPSHRGEAAVGDIVIVEAAARGTGSAALAAAPRVRIIGPDKRNLPFLHADAALGEFRAEGESFSGERIGRVSFQPMEAGLYTIELEPYAWYDTAGDSVRSANATPLYLRVKARGYEAWEPSEGQRAALEALIAAGGGGASGATRENAAGRLAKAARSLLEGDALSALGEAKALERGFWPLRGASALAGMALDALGLERGGKAELLPAPAWFALAALPCALMAAALFYQRAKRARRAAPLPPFSTGKPANARSHGVFLALPAILCLCLIVMCMASWAERSRERAIVLVSALRAVPDEGASSPFSVAPGSQATIVSEGGGWLFLEFGDGRSAWIRADLISRY